MLKKSKVSGVLITNAAEAPEAPSIPTVEKYGGYPVAFDVHPDYINDFLNSKLLHSAVKASLVFLKKTTVDKTRSEKENLELQKANMVLQRALIRVLSQYP